MLRHALVLLVFLVAVLTVRSEQPVKPPPEQPKVIKLAPSSAKPTRALEHTLLPDPLDLKPGNAATYWRLAGNAAASVQHKYDPKEDAWTSDETPLKDLPRKDIRAHLALYARALRLADQAARCERCDWELPAFTLQSLQDYPLDDLQRCRQLARLLQLRARLELSEGKFDDCLYTLQTGFALARHVGDGDTMIQSLVGIALASIMLGSVEEMMQVPGSPNLFWALTALPSPFIDIRRPMQMELNTIYRSYPPLRELERRGVKKPLTAAEVDQLVDGLLTELAKAGGDTPPAWLGKIGLALMMHKVYPDAKAYLLERGHTEKEIEALPMKQAVTLYYLDQNSRLRDDILKWLHAPAWQASQQLVELARVARQPQPSGVSNPFIALLMPAFVKVHEASIRTDHLLARLRCAEALRLYAAAHDGQSPTKFSDIGDLPLPLDPYTGKSFEEGYRFKDDHGTLTTPATSPLMKPLQRRYEIGK